MIPVFLIVACLVIVLLTKLTATRVEKFSAVKAEMMLQSYIQEVRFIASYVGPYLGEIYTYLRAKYADPASGIPMPMYYQPQTPNDAVLKDPLLSIARTQVKSWIDSEKARLSKVYDEVFLRDARRLYDLSYTEGANGVVTVTMIDKGQPQTYIV